MFKSNVENIKQHKWIVYSTAISTGELLLICNECKIYATVQDPSEEEWGQAFHAPSRPYVWHDETRVVTQ